MADLTNMNKTKKIGKGGDTLISSLSFFRESISIGRLIKADEFNLLNSRCLLDGNFVLAAYACFGGVRQMVVDHSGTDWNAQCNFDLRNADVQNTAV